MKKYLNILGTVFLFAILTVLTQIGGLVYLLSKWLRVKFQNTIRIPTFIWFLLTYIFLTFGIIPFVAPILGREKIKNTERISPANYMTVILNRNYVIPQINLLLTKVEADLKNSAIHIRYLDANFPFINKFPLLPHLSHKDGKKLDVSLVYENENGITDKVKSISGYGVFVLPKSNENSQPKKCLNEGYFQYDYPKYLTLGSVNDELKFSVKGTKQLIKSILKSDNVEKVFIEPHLKSRMLLVDKRIRYHGCRAVRHDDHIHLQVK